MFRNKDKITHKIEGCIEDLAYCDTTQQQRALAMKIVDSTHKLESTKYKAYAKPIMRVLTKTPINIIGAMATYEVAASRNFETLQREGEATSYIEKLKDGLLPKDSLSTGFETLSELGEIALAQTPNMTNLFDIIQDLQHSVHEDIIAIARNLQDNFQTTLEATTTTIILYYILNYLISYHTLGDNDRLTDKLRKKIMRPRVKKYRIHNKKI